MMWFISAIALLTVGSAYAQDCCLDICFLVDASSSINRLNWDGFVLPYIQQVVDALHPDVDFNVGIQTFSDKPVGPSLYLTNYAANSDLVDEAIENLVYIKGLTDIATGIEKCQNLILGGDNNREDCPDVIVLISDGVPTTRGPDTIPAANASKDAGTFIVSVGVGDFSTAILEEISSNDKVIRVDNFQALLDVVDTTFNNILEACPPETTTVGPTPPLTTTLPLPPPPICPTCDGTHIPKPTYEFGSVQQIPLQWVPTSAFNPPSTEDPPPEDLFAFEQYILYGSSYTYYTDNEIPANPTTTPSSPVG
jgi:hypothetical protein